MRCRVWPRLRGLTLGLALLPGCGGGESPAEPLGERRVVLGTGEASFEPIVGEPELPLVAGVQGGFHVWASFLAYGFSSRTLSAVIVTSVEGVSGSRLVMRPNLTARETLDADGTPAYTFAGFPAQVYDARCAHGRRVQIELQLVDGAGGSAEDSRHCIAALEQAFRSTECD